MPSIHWLNSGWRGHLLAIPAGALVSLALAPYDLWPLGILSYFLLAWLWSNLTPRAALLRGWCYGFGLFGVGTSWIYVSIHDYGNASWLLAGTLTALFCAAIALCPALAGYCYSRWIRERPFGSTLGLAAVLLLTDWIRSWLLTGFPWLYVGYGHIHSPLAGWAPVIGVFGIGFIVTLTGALLYRALSRRDWIALAIILPLWLSGWGLTTLQWSEPTQARPLRVALVQANIPQSVKWDPDEYWRTLNLYVSLSRPLWSQADIVVWPEAAIPGYYQRAKPFLERIDAVARREQSALVTGIPYRDAEGRYYNSILAVGNGEGLYHKQRLVPFGEYVPLEHWLRGLISFFDLPMSAFSAGKADQSPLRVQGISLAPFICYEVVYPNLLSDWLPDADALLTISNDAWFGDSLGPLQHLQMAQMRALESARYMIRGTGNGISAVIAPNGEILARSEQFVQQTLQGEFYPMRGATPIAYTGYWPIVIFSCLIVLILITTRR